MMCTSILKVRWAVPVLLMGVFFSLGMRAPQPADPGLPPGFSRLREEMESGRGPGLLNVSYRMADTSLAVREQVDFLLTPALLVQEAVSEDVVLTYPEE